MDFSQCLLWGITPNIQIVSKGAKRVTISQDHSVVSTVAGELIPRRSDSRRTRTFDRLLRRQLLYPSELASRVLVPIAANPELARGSPQWSLDHFIIVADLNQIANPDFSDDHACQ